MDRLSVTGSRKRKDNFGFEKPVQVGLPSVRGLILSIFLHALAVVGLANVSFKALPLTKLDPEIPDATHIRIGDRLYFVAQISAPPTLIKLPKLTTPRVRARRRPTETAAIEAPPAPVAERHPNVPRAFIPPELRRDPISDRTLIQPLFPPDLVPANVDLPSFRLLTSQVQLPKLPPKTFVAPGRKTPVPPDQPPPPPAPPELTLVSADPAPRDLKAALFLPPTPPPLLEAPKLTEPDAKPPSPAGESLNILSISDRPVPASDRVLVPPGNMVGKSGDGTDAITGASDARTAASASRGSATGKPAESGSPGSSATLSASASPRGASGSAAGVVVTGGTSAAGRAGTAIRPSVVITRPATGDFDAVVVQSSPLDQFPEGKRLLSGRPIYSVYISVDTSKEWALYFCVPEAAGSSSAPVVNLGSQAPVRAPYPTRIIRPGITLPSYEKYVLVHGFVSSAGRVQDLRVIGSNNTENNEVLAVSLTGWEFRAATRDGVPITVEFLLSIPAAGL